MSSRGFSGIATNGNPRHNKQAGQKLVASTRLSPQRTLLRKDHVMAVSKYAVPQISGKDIQRFWSKVKIAGPDECWLWTAGGHGQGYGHFTITRRCYKSHQVAKASVVGPIPPGSCVCHTCDNPPCCNPAHLFIGTDTDNARDKIAKGRARPQTGENHWMKKHPELIKRGDQHHSHLHPELRVRGSKHGNAILNEQLVVEIRDRHRSGETYRSMSAAFHVSRSTIKSVVTRRMWRHVP